MNYLADTLQVLLAALSLYFQIKDRDKKSPQE